MTKTRPCKSDMKRGKLLMRDLVFLGPAPLTKTSEKLVLNTRKQILSDCTERLGNYIFSKLEIVSFGGNNFPATGKKPQRMKKYLVFISQKNEGRVLIDLI